MIGNKIAHRTTKVFRNIPQNNSETITNEHDKEIPKGRYISPEERQKVINDLRWSRGIYDKDNQIRFKTLMLKAGLWNYSDAYTLRNTAAQGLAQNTGDKKVIFKCFVPFTNCIYRINNIQVDHANDTDVVMAMYNLIDYSDNCSKTSAIL